MMIESWITLIAMGLVVSFMPSILALEAVMLGTKDGKQKVIGLLSGVTLARLIVAFGVFSVFASVLDILGLVAIWTAESVANLLTGLHAFIVAEGFWLVDIVLTIAGIMLILEALSYLSNKPKGGNSAVAEDAIEKDAAQEEATAEKEGKSGILNSLGLGLILTITGPKQLVLTVAAMNVIIAMPPVMTFQFSALAAYLLFGLTIIGAPLVLAFVRPQQAEAVLSTMNGWITGVMRYAIAAVLGAVGLYFLWNGGMDIVRSIFGQ